MEKDYPPFYEALVCESPTEWVAQNVLPVLQTNPVARKVLTDRICEYLDDGDDITLVADWPEDIAHAAALLSYKGKRHIFKQRIRFELIDGTGFDCSKESEVPHNAYYDALALREFFEKQIARS
ncbi:hypothetical protein [Parasphingorhabdus sp.]|uniref:hypothetical protein n=1 Tax=Parasphingorhabdus sp. TaxID=2709688 RepID=UPI003267EB3D